MKEISSKGPHIMWFHLFEMSRVGKFIETESTFVVARGWGRLGRYKEEWGMTANGQRISFWCDENILELESGDCYTTLF